MAKNQCQVSFCFVVSKIFEELTYKRLNYLEKCGLISYFLYGFWPSCSTVDLLIVVSDIIVVLYHRFRAAGAVALDIA